MTEVSLSTFQLTALSALIVTNERMIVSDEISFEQKVVLRWLVSQVISAFKMPAIYERETQDNTPAPDFERKIVALTEFAKGRQS